MLLNMAGKNYILGLVVTLFCFCNNHKKNDQIGKELISQNINILLDSIEHFDLREIKRPKKFQKNKIEKIKVGLLDSIIIDKSNLQESKNISFVKFNIIEEDLSKYKSDYVIKIVKINNYDTNTLFVRFSNFEIINNTACITVKKVIGLSMVKNVYYFKRINSIWKFQKKEFLELG